jgi:hypothetical protein
MIYVILPVSRIQKGWELPVTRGYSPMLGALGNPGY